MAHLAGAATLTGTDARSTGGLPGGAPRRLDKGRSRKVHDVVAVFFSCGTPPTVDARRLTPLKNEVAAACLQAIAAALVVQVSSSDPSPFYAVEPPVPSPLRLACSWTEPSTVHHPPRCTTLSLFGQSSRALPASVEDTIGLCAIVCLPRRHQTSTPPPLSATTTSTSATLTCTGYHLYGVHTGPYSNHNIRTVTTLQLWGILAHRLLPSALV